MDSASDIKFKKHEIITTIIKSAAFGVILFLIISLTSGKPKVGNESEIIGGILKLIFSSFIAGSFAGFAAGKNTTMSIKAAVTGAIIGSTLYISISNLYFFDLPVWFLLLYGAALVFVILIVIPAIRGEGWAAKTATIGSILLLAIFGAYYYSHPRYHYPTWNDILFGSILIFIIFIIIPAIIGGTAGGWVRRHRPY